MDFTPSQQKLPFWRVAYQSLIWNQTLSNITQYIFLMLNNIHCIVILISFHFIAAENQNTLLLESLKKMSQSMIFHKVANFDIKNRTIVAIISMISLYLLSFILIHSSNLWAYYRNKKLKSWKETLSISFAQFHLLIGFWAINAFLMDFIHASNNDSPSLFVISVFLVITNYILAGLFSLYSYDPFFSSNALSCYTPTYQVLTTLFKCIAAPLIFFPSSVTKWIFIASSFIILAARQYYLLSSLSYYKYSAIKVCVILSTISCLLIFLIFLALAIDSNHFLSSQTLLFTQLLLSPFVVYAALVSFKKSIFQSLSKPNSELKSPQDIIKKLIAILVICEKTQLIFSENARKNFYELEFWGLLGINHSSNNQTSYNQILNTIIEKLLHEMVLKFPDNIRLKILQIYFGLQLNTNTQILAFYLRDVPQVQYLTQRLYQKLQENMDHSIAEYTVIDIRQYIEQDNLAETFAKAINRNIKDYLVFWKEYLKPQAHIKQLFIQSKIIEKDAEFIESFWNKHSDTNKLFAPTFYTTYSPYLRLLKAAPFQGYQLAQKYASRKQEETYNAHQEGFNESSLTDPNVICIHTCMNQESPGKILKVTPNIVDLVGWSPEDVVNESLGNLIPKFIAHGHQKILFEYLDNLYKNQKPSNRIHQDLATFLLHKAGHILPCNIYLTLHPCVQQNLVYVGLIKIKQLGVEQIILDSDGEIEGFTKEIGKSLSLTTAGHTKININAICLNFSEIREALQISQERTKQHLICFKEFNCLVDVNLFYFREKTYYILSLSLPEKQKNKLELNVNIENDISLLSDEFDEFTKTPKNRQKLLSPIRTKKTFQTEEEGIFTTMNCDEGKSPSRKKQRNILTSHGDSFAVEDHFNPATIVTTQRSLLLSSRQKNRNAPESLIKTPTYADPTMKRVKTRLEMTLPMIPKNPFVTLFFLCMILLIVASSIPLIAFQTRAEKTLALVHRNGETLSSLIFMLAKYIDLHHSFRFLWQGELGILAPDRWNKIGYDTFAMWGISVFGSIRWSLPLFASIVEDGNNDVRSNVYQLDSEIKKQIYQGTVPVYEIQDDGSMRSTRRDTLFDLSTELFSQTIKFANSWDVPANPTNPYMMFVLSNTMNESLVLGDKEISILTQDSSIKLKNLDSFIYAMMIMVSLLAVAVFAFFVFGTQKFLKERNHFLDIFAMLNEASIVEHMSLVKNFKECLVLTSFSVKDRKLQSFKPAQNHSSRRRKILHRSGINNLIIILHLTTLAFLVLIFSAYPILYSQVGPGNKILLRKMDFMVQSNMNYYYTVFAFNIISVYVQEPNSRVKEMPLEAAWLENYQKLAAVQNFISDDLLDPKTGMGSDLVIHKNAVGNLCEMYSVDDPFEMNNCRTIGGGFLTKGVSGINSFFMAFSQSMFLSFKYSNQTLEAAKEAMDNTQAIIWETFGLFIYASYENIDKRIRTTMLKDFDKLNKSILRVTVAFIIIYALVGSWLAWKIQKRLRIEMTDWRKMLRRIPYPVANENQHLKAFIKKTTGFL